MQRYLMKQRIELQQEIFVDEMIKHHLKNVMRFHDGDLVIVIDETGRNFQMEIKDVDKGLLYSQELIENDSELDVAVTLIYAWPKGSKWELVLQKAAELGVNRIVPWQSMRSIVKVDSQKYAKKRVRYQKILDEAVEQAKRNTRVILEDPVDLKGIKAYLGDHNLVAYEETAKQGDHTGLGRIMAEVKAGDSLTIIVGSEGGIDSQEIAYFKELGIKSCSLGKRILRSETAPLYLLSIIGYEREVRR